VGEKVLAIFAGVWYKGGIMQIIYNDITKCVERHFTWVEFYTCGYTGLDMAEQLKDADFGYVIMQEPYPESHHVD